MSECPFRATTFNFGDAGVDDVFTLELDGTDLYFETISRGLSEDNACEVISQEIPPLDWQTEMILWYNSASADEKALVRAYTNYSYEAMNERLRKIPSASAPLNDLIARAIPLPMDIIVYRHFRDEYIPEQGEFVHNGYLSTSFSARFVVKGRCSYYQHYGKPGFMLRIKVKAGTKCLYIPSHEVELILPHGSILSITGKHLQSVQCSRDTTATVWIYDAVLESR